MAGDSASRRRAYLKWYKDPKNRRSSILRAKKWREENQERHNQLIRNWRAKGNNYENMKKSSALRSQIQCTGLHNIYLARLLCRTHGFKVAADVPAEMITAKRREIIILRSVRKAEEEKKRNTSPCAGCRLRDKEWSDKKERCGSCADRINFVELMDKALKVRYGC